MDHGLALRNTALIHRTTHVLDSHIFSAILSTLWLRFMQSVRMKECPTVAVFCHVFADISVFCCDWRWSAARGLAKAKGILGASVHWRRH